MKISESGMGSEPWIKVRILPWLTSGNQTVITDAKEAETQHNKECCFETRGARDLLRGDNRDQIFGRLRDASVPHRVQIDLGVHSAS